eukprot:TRINITY_DN8398_c0_g1_i1.p2 TRINITY_DN8398_c0_g1~~TRINITY_DN8398_c0_g1_i1.p2  ORF type:complete len:361 (+),score=0.87 TRINITY_DN8398_c0_g1_i1:86-1168(+)
MRSRSATRSQRTRRRPSAARRLRRRPTGTERRIACVAAVVVRFAPLAAGSGQCCYQYYCSTDCSPASSYCQYNRHWCQQCGGSWCQLETPQPPLPPPPPSPAPGPYSPSPTSPTPAWVCNPDSNTCDPDAHGTPGGHPSWTACYFACPPTTPPTTPPPAWVCEPSSGECVAGAHGAEGYPSQGDCSAVCSPPPPAPYAAPSAAPAAGGTPQPRPGRTPAPVTATPRADAVPPSAPPSGTRTSREPAALAPNRPSPPASSFPRVVAGCGAALAVLVLAAAVVLARSRRRARRAELYTGESIARMVEETQAFPGSPGGPPMVTIGNAAVDDPGWSTVDVWQPCTAPPLDGSTNPSTEPITAR